MPPVGSNLDLALRLALDLAATTVLVRLIYFPRYRRTDLFLTFFVFNVVVFLITYLMNAVDMTLGAAFGLFAVFSILRFRTEGISAKDMTYLFLVIALGLAFAISADWATLMLAGGSLLALTYALEADWLGAREQTREVFYERAALTRPTEREALLGDLRERTGLDIHRVDVKEVDFVRDTARLTVYYRDRDPA